MKIIRLTNLPYASIAISLLAMLFVSIYPVMFLYFQNIDVAFFYEAIRVSAIFFSIAMLCFFLCLLYLRSIVKSAFAACIFVFCFVNYAFIEYAVRFIFNAVQIWHLIPIVFFVFCHIVYLLKKRISGETAFKLTSLVGIVFAALILVNVISSTPQILGRISQSTPTARVGFVHGNPSEYSVKHPNIYFFIFDEYSSFTMLEKYFDFDNSAFAEFLEERGFTISHDSFNPWTSTHFVVANLMDLDYVWLLGDPSLTVPVLMDVWADNALFRLLESFGYSIHGIGAAPMYFGLDGSRIASTTIEGLSFTNILLMNSMVGFLINDEHLLIETARQVFDMRDSIRYLQPEPGNMFVLSYVVSPHIPFIFDEAGNLHMDMSIASDLSNPAGYLMQLSFITSLIKEMVNRILEVDPDSIIILQSDHGARNLICRETGENLIAPLHRRNILNAVYFRGQPLPQIKGQSGVNTLRIIMSELFGLYLPLVEVP